MLYDKAEFDDPDTDDSIANNNSLSGKWVTVKGYGRLGLSELEKLIDEGKIKVYDVGGKTKFEKK